MTVKEFNEMEGKYNGSFEIDGVELTNYHIRDTWDGRIHCDMRTWWETFKTYDYPDATLQDFLEEVDCELNCMGGETDLVPEEIKYTAVLHYENGSSDIFGYETEEEADGQIEWWTNYYKRTNRKKWHKTGSDLVRWEKGVI